MCFARVRVMNIVKCMCLARWVLFAESIMSLFRVDERVRVNWQSKGRYYDAQISAIHESGFDVVFLDDTFDEADRYEKNVSAQDIIGMLTDLILWDAYATLPHAC